MSGLIGFFARSSSIKMEPNQTSLSKKEKHTWERESHEKMISDPKMHPYDYDKYMNAAEQGPGGISSGTLHMKLENPHLKQKNMKCNRCRGPLVWSGELRNYFIKGYCKKLAGLP